MSPRCPIAAAAKTAPRAKPARKSPSSSPSKTPAVRASPAPTRSSADDARVAVRKISPSFPLPPALVHPVMSRPASDTTTHFAPDNSARPCAVSPASPVISNTFAASFFGQKTTSAIFKIGSNPARAWAGVHSCAR